MRRTDRAVKTGAGAADAAPRAWTEAEFAALRQSMAAMLREARAMGLSGWELRPVADPDVTAGRRAARIRQRRSDRDALFSHPELFGESAWDMLLHLFALHERGLCSTVGDAIMAARVPVDVGAEHLVRLERRGLVDRIAGIGGDRLALGAGAAKTMRRFLDESSL